MNANSAWLAKNIGKYYEWLWSSRVKILDLSQVAEDVSMLQGKMPIDLPAIDNQIEEEEPEIPEATELETTEDSFSDYESDEDCCDDYLFTCTSEEKRDITNRDATNIRMWLLTNQNPSDDEKNQIAQEIGITILQMNILLTHQRYSWLNNRGPLQTSRGSRICYHYPASL